MTELATITLFIGLVAYSVAATLFFVDIARREATPYASRWASRLLLVGVLAHALQVVLASFVTHTCPVESLPFALSLSALITAMTYLVLRRSLRIDTMGVAVVPIALTFLVGAQFVGTAPGDGHLSRGLLALHVTANLLGVGLFLLAGAAGAFYIAQERRLKAHRMPSRLPALDALDKTEHRLLMAGFPLLTLGAVSGAAFISQVDMSQAQLIRVVLAYVTWALLAGVLVLRATLGWRGRRAAYGTIVGVAGVMLLLFIYILRGTGAA
jgi:ABC-type uncharacterized transport system permease subunit